MRSSKTSLLRLLLLLALLIVAAPELAAAGIGSGPAVGSDFDIVPFHRATGDRTVYVAWRDAQSNLASGVLHLDDGAFAPFPTLTSGYLTNLSVGAGGPTGARRAYATWVDQQMRLKLAVFNPDGQVVSLPQIVSNSVQVSPNQLVGTDTGVLIGHVWDTEPYWDPRILEVDVSGSVLDLEIAENVGSPEQTLGATLAGEPGGSHAIAYITSDARLVRLRRYGTTEPLDPSPVVVSRDAAGDYVPLSTTFSQDPPARVLLAFPYDPGGTRLDVRFAVAPLSTGPVTVGPVLSDLVPGFVGRVTDLATLADPEARAVVLWQEIELEDLETCGCSVPAPVRVDFFAIVLAMGPPITVQEGPLLVYRWMRGDPIGRPITDPRLAVMAETPWRFTVVWSDGILRYVDVDRGTVAVEEPSPQSAAGSLSSHPNPFALTTTIAYSLTRSGPARLRIVDVRGREVAVRLLGGGQGSTGIVHWDARDREGRPLPAGIYFALLDGPGKVKSTKLVLTP